MKLIASFRVLFYTALAFCLGTRIWLRQSGLIDPITGFYTGAPNLVLAYNAVLALCVAALYALYLLRRTERDYPVLHSSRPVCLLAILTGIAIALYQLEALRIPAFLTANPGVRLDSVPLIVSAVLGLFSAVVFVSVGVIGLLGHTGMRGGFPTLMAGVWLVLTLVFKFNGYTTLTTISDNLLTVLFMAFGSLFLVGHARTLGGFARKDGRNYTIPTGLATALFGFLLVIPNWVWMAANSAPSLPAPLLGTFESVFVFFMSAYALLFVRHICLGIQRV